MRTTLFALLCAFAVPTVIVSAPTAAQAKKKKRKKKGIGAKKAWKKAKKGFKVPKRKFTVHNCSSRRATVCVYNAGDNAKHVKVARLKKGLRKGEKWSTDCEDWTNYAGVKEGKKARGWCKVHVTRNEICPVDVGRDVARVGSKQNLYIGDHPSKTLVNDGKTEKALWARRGETGHCASKP